MQPLSVYVPILARFDVSRLISTALFFSYFVKRLQYIERSDHAVLCSSHDLIKFFVTIVTFQNAFAYGILARA